MSDISLSNSVAYGLLSILIAVPIAAKITDGHAHEVHHESR